MSPISKQESISKWQLLTQFVFLSVVSLGMCIQITLKDWHNSQKLMVNSKWTQQYFSRYFSLIILYFGIFFTLLVSCVYIMVCDFNDFLCVDESLPLCVYVFILFLFICLFVLSFYSILVYLFNLPVFLRERKKALVYMIEENLQGDEGGEVMLGIFCMNKSYCQQN